MLIFFSQAKKVDIENKDKTWWMKSIHEQPKNAYFFPSPLWNCVKILSGTTIYKLHQLALPCIDVLNNNNILSQNHIQTIYMAGLLTSSIAKSFVGQENKINLNHKGKK
jgi:hypothetical protein